MNRKELEAVVTELEEFEKANNHDGTKHIDSPDGDIRREYAFHIGSILDHCHALGFNPWPKIKPFFDTYSISVLPEYPAFEKMVVLARNSAKKAEASKPISDSQLFQIFDLTRQLLRVAQVIEAQIPYPEDPRQKEWQAKRAQKESPSRPDKPREPFDRPNLPIQSREDIENALKEMYYFTRDTVSKTGEMVDIGYDISHFGMASSFLGYLPHPELAKMWRDVSLEDLPDEREVYVEMLNKVYRLYVEVRDAGAATSNQVFRMYRLTWRMRTFGKECGVRLRSIVKALN